MTDLRVRTTESPAPWAVPSPCDFRNPAAQVGRVTCAPVTGPAPAVRRSRLDDVANERPWRQGRREGTVPHRDRGLFGELVGCVGQVRRDVRSTEPAEREGRDLLAVGGVQSDYCDRPIAVAEGAHLEARVARRRPDAHRAWADEAAVARERPQSARGRDGVALDLNQPGIGTGDGRRARVAPHR